MSGYYRSPDERIGQQIPHDPNEAIRSEFLPVEGISHSRRSFLKAVGFGFAGATMVGCSRAPSVHAIPYLVAPETITPGKAYWIATTCAGCEAGCGVLAKCMDGRPIKLEGNPECPISGGGLCAPGQASILSLYDSLRLDGPFQGSRESRQHDRGLVKAEWSEVDAAVRTRLDGIRKSGGRVRVLTATVNSPSTRSMIERFLGEFADGKHVAYDPISTSAILDAHARTHGTRVLPRMRFDRARSIVSFDADFLGTWISPVEFARGYQSQRNPDAKTMANHIQFEARMSLTGARADRRVRLAPWETGTALNALCRRLELQKGVETKLDEQPMVASLTSSIETAATELWRNRGKAIVVCGSNDVEHQVLVNYANELLGSYGTTLDVERPSLQRAGDDRAILQLIDELASGQVDALVIHGVNPVYDLPDAATTAAALAEAGLVIQLGTHEDETSASCHFVCAELHGLESWNDAEPVAGIYKLMQPTIPAIRDGRTLRQCLAAWIGEAKPDRELLSDHWKRAIYPSQTGHATPEAFLNAALERGFASDPSTKKPVASAFDASAVRSPAKAPARGETELGLVLYAKVGMPDGRHAHNPWLHELPDPVSKIAWDNYAALSPAAATKLEVAQGDLVRVTLQGRARDLPVQIQPGQHDSVVAVALGYGRKGTDRFHGVGPRWIESRTTVETGASVGVSASPFVRVESDGRRYDAPAVRLERRPGHFALACTQDHHSLSVPEHLAPASGAERDIVKVSDHKTWKQRPDEAFPHEKGHPAEIWSHDHEHDGARWTMAVDLSACTGCSACVIACQAENNVPLVGKDEVRRHREMSWLRIDRYYKGEGDDVETVHQPIMCQHCANAPCETVCPVLATVHGDEGLNQQVYNRCVGTRYCANNCPYKVRRFNWFDYSREDQLQNMALNPDVTIRSRGVMEKCSMCVQRIQAAKAEATRSGRTLRDGDIQLACQQSCPTQAIVFGDGSDPESRVAKKLESQRAYTVLPELNVKPVVNYLGVVRNREEGRG